MSSCFFCGGKDEVWLVPEGYRGWVIIIPNQQDGLEEKVVDNKRIYEIPDSGVLKTKYALTDGWHKSESYLIDKDGKRRNLKWCHSKSDTEGLEKGEPYLFWGFTSQVTPFPYPKFFAVILHEKGKENDPGIPDAKDYVLEYAKRNNDI